MLYTNFIKPLYKDLRASHPYDREHLRGMIPFSISPFQIAVSWCRVHLLCHVKTGTSCAPTSCLHFACSDSHQSVSCLIDLASRSGILFYIWPSFSCCTSGIQFLVIVRHSFFISDWRSHMHPGASSQSQHHNTGSFSSSYTRNCFNVH